MAEALVSKLDPFLDITAKGNHFEISTNGAATASLDLSMATGDATALSMSVKVRLKSGRVQALPLPITITSGNLPYFNRAINVVGASALVLTVDTKGTTSNSLMRVVSETFGSASAATVAALNSSKLAVQNSSNPLSSAIGDPGSGDPTGP